MWFNIASANAHEEAPERRERIARDMTPKDITTAQAMAIESA
jgi:hypothetical protein